jgi:DNA polymerase III epsilon subunit-like protein
MIRLMVARHEIDSSDARHAHRAVQDARAYHAMK